MEAADLTIRLATPDDAEAILNIYKPYIEHTVITFECEIPSVEEFRERIVAILKRHPYLVADTDQGIIGYAYASDFKGRSAYDWSVETSIYVDMNWRGCGIGTVLYRVLEEWLKKQNVVNLYACITYPNAQSIRFHQTFRYKKVAHFRNCGYKKKKWRSVIWMWKTIARHRRKPQAVLSMDELRILMLDHVSPLPLSDLYRVNTGWDTADTAMADEVKTPEGYVSEERTAEKRVPEDHIPEEHTTEDHVSAGCITEEYTTEEHASEDRIIEERVSAGLILEEHITESASDKNSEEVVSAKTHPDKADAEAAEPHENTTTAQEASDTPEKKNAPARSNRPEQKI